MHCCFRAETPTVAGRCAFEQRCSDGSFAQQGRESGERNAHDARHWRRRAAIGSDPWGFTSAVICPQTICLRSCRASSTSTITSTCELCVLSFFFASLLSCYCRGHTARSAGMTFAASARGARHQTKTTCRMRTFPVCFTHAFACCFAATTRLCCRTTSASRSTATKPARSTLTRSE